MVRLLGARNQRHFFGINCIYFKYLENKFHSFKVITFVREHDHLPNTTLHNAGWGLVNGPLQRKETTINNENNRKKYDFTVHMYRNELMVHVGLVIYLFWHFLAVKSSFHDNYLVTYLISTYWYSSLKGNYQFLMKTKVTEIA